MQSPLSNVNYKRPFEESNADNNEMDTDEATQSEESKRARISDTLGSIH